MDRKTALEARQKMRAESITRMAQLKKGDFVTNVCAGLSGRHLRFLRYEVVESRNKAGISSSQHFAVCVLKGKQGKFDIDAIYPGHLSEDESTKLFRPLWEAKHPKG